MLIILIFISIVFAPLPPPTHNALPETFIQQNLKLSPDQQLVKLNVLSALPDDIQVKIILDTQNAQNAIQWLKMNKGSSHKLFKVPKFKQMLPEVLKLSIMDKYYNADILKRILDYPNLVNWDINTVETDIQYVMGIHSFVEIIKDIDLSSAAGKQINEYTLLNIMKFINDNTGKSVKFLSQNFESLETLAKIILSDDDARMKFTNDLAISDLNAIGQMVIQLTLFKNINILKLILDNYKVSQGFNAGYFDNALILAVITNNMDFIKAVLGDRFVSHHLDMGSLFKTAAEQTALTVLEELTHYQKLFAKIPDILIIDDFEYCRSSFKQLQRLNFYLHNRHYYEKIDANTFKDKMIRAMADKNFREISLLLDAKNMWKVMKFSRDFKNSYLNADFSIREFIDKNELFKNKIEEIEG